MSFDWTHYHSLSRDLLNNHPSGLDEAAFRCAMSRSYYAAFCMARDWAASRGEIASTGTAEDHGIVMRHFRDSPNDDRHRIGVWLKRLLSDRAEADYNTKTTIVQASAEASVKVAGRLLNTLKLPTL